MIDICTTSDTNYLIKGLTLYESLLIFTKNFRLHYLCIDELSYNKLIQYSSDTLIVYNIHNLLVNDSKLELLKNTDYRYFCWSLASYFTNYLMKNKIVDEITYIDSDILFYDDLRVILNAIDFKEVGLFRHRQFDLTSNRPEGWFNVGVLHFKRGDVGQDLLNWWADAVLNQKYPHLATCGDQKYLDQLLSMVPEDTIFIDGNIGHGAPWLWQLYDLSTYVNDGCITWGDKKQKLVFTHFSQFVMCDVTYIPSTQHHIYTPIANYNTVFGLKIIYDDYYNRLIKIKLKYNIV
jgi:hypothetical protein